MDHCVDPQGVVIMSSDRIEALSRSLADATSRRRLLTLLGVGAASTSLTAVGLNEALAQSNNGPVGNRLTHLPVRGKGKKGTFEGHADIIGFKQGGATGIQAVALLSGKVKGKDVEKKKTVKNKRVVFPVSVTGVPTEVQSQVICEILNLVLGPIDLNLLGLRLQTNRIRVRLTADSQGGLLGSLLCGLAGPIGGGPLGQLVTILNQILGILQGL
jgi:hypothetical protein